jgi:hypothetical protein
MSSRTLVILVLVATWLLAPSWAAATQVRVLFTPGATDPAITNFNNNHYAVVDPALTNRGRLVLFLPGTGAVPLGYTEFVKNAASLGFNALGLMYPNGEAINALCVQYAPLDPEAAGNARLEVIDGSNRVSFVSVDRANGIENRLLKALQYLHANYPANGWSQFFDGNTVLWDSLVVCGHSQGAGMAGLLAKTRLVDRCVMFTDMDWWVAGGRPYNWMSSASQTPLNRWFLLAHERDQYLDFTNMQIAASALELDRYGPYEQVETSTAPDFQGRHFLSTDLNPAASAPGSYHGMPVYDAAIPYQADGRTPVLKPTWDYLLLHDTAPPPTVITGITLNNGLLSLAISNLTATITNRVLRCTDLIFPVWSTTCTFMAVSGQTNWAETCRSNQEDGVFYRIESE